MFRHELLRFIARFRTLEGRYVKTGLAMLYLCSMKSILIMEHKRKYENHHSDYHSLLGHA